MATHYSRKRKADRKAFIDGLEVWEGDPDKGSIALSYVEGLGVQGGRVILKTFGNDGEENQFAMRLEAMARAWADLNQHAHPDDFREEQDEMVKALELALQIVRAAEAK